jgi:hypothetical protein
MGVEIHLEEETQQKRFDFLTAKVRLSAAEKRLVS